MAARSGSDFDADAIVIGGGLAGLCAARELRRRGRSAIVLEAQPRAGGRTLSVELNGHTVEVGGRWTGPGQDQIKALAAELGIGFAEPSMSGAAVHVRKGERYVAPRGRSTFGPSVAIDELLALVRTIDRLADSVPVHAPWQTPEAAALDRVTMSAWLADHASPEVAGAAASILEGFLPQVHESSLLHGLFYMKSNGGLAGVLGLDGPPHDNELFKGGAAGISRALAVALGPQLRLGTIAFGVTQDPAGVIVHGRDLEVRGRYAVVAMAPCMAGRLFYEPALPPMHDYFLQRMPIRGKFSVCLMYSSAFWRDEGLSGFARSERLTAYDVSGQSAPGLLGALVSNATSRQLWPLDAAARRSAIIDAFVECFGESARNPIGFVEHNWAGDTFTRGCNSFCPPGVWTAYGPAWGMPVGRVLWAGAEYSPDFFGQMEGAVRTGTTAGLEIATRLAA